ncbi:MAG: 2-C-methyl-D-erythritol 4-phosphate cytidylyltransferase [Candidatus Hinthialibacter antarcticus]|nr:2-C-methyl-D-erythritol 4-phosphate cytidylyltransferase [Candidatus Hinthialibacter antarcticus]
MSITETQSEHDSGNHDKTVAVVVVAAGKSRRMGGGRNKVLNHLAGRPILSYCLSVFQSHPAVTHVAIAGREDDREEILSIASQYCPKAEGLFTPGGAERFDSVKHGLEALVEVTPDVVLIHDAARPFIQPQFIDASLEALQEVDGCVIGVPLKDTLKETDEKMGVVQTHDRSKFWLAQTPQSFRYAMILDAYQRLTPPPYPTDDGAVLEEMGEAVTMVMGSYLNMKVTTPEDITLAEAIAARQE